MVSIRSIAALLFRFNRTSVELKQPGELPTADRIIALIEPVWN